jgi:FAD/FMN-containing dehydrogenase
VELISHSNLKKKSLFSPLANILTLKLEFTRRHVMTEKQLSDIIGRDNIVDDEMILAQYSSDMSFVPELRPKCVVKVQKAEQVQELIQWSNESATPLIPISSGPPHFRGDTVPSSGGAIVVDLSGLKKIIRIDRTNRVAMVETGVTFGELVPKLDKAGLKLNLPLLPRSNKSVVGSMLDREPVLMPLYQWDSQDPLTCVEVIFGSGDKFRTGSAAGPGTLEDQWSAKQAQVNPMGPGQTDFGRVIQGSQGTLGIVTWATIRCEILPQMQKPFLIGSNKYEKLADFVYRMLWWKAGEECLILNRAELAAILAATPAEYQNLKDTLPPYLLFFSLAGFEYFPAEKIEYQEKALIDEAKRLGLTMGNSVAGTSSQELLRLFNKPSGEPHWKLRRKGSCQDIAFLTTLDRIHPFVLLMEEQANRYGYSTADIGTYIQPMVQGTSCQCEFTLFYNPDNKREAARVKELYVQAGKALMDAGAFFGRPYGLLVDEIYRRDAETTVSLRKVKKIFDPNNILNPGKLCF